MHGNSCTAQRIQDRPKISTCFGVMVKPPAFSCRDDVLVKNGAAAPKSCPPSLEMRPPTVAGGLNHLQQATSSALLDRGEVTKDEFEDSDSIRLTRQQFLACCPILPDGYRDKTGRK